MYIRVSAQDDRKKFKYSFAFVHAFTDSHSKFPTIGPQRNSGSAVGGPNCIVRLGIASERMLSKVYAMDDEESQADAREDVL
jgi:hypothetical protein